MVDDRRRQCWRWTMDSKINKFNLYILLRENWDYEAMVCAYSHIVRAAHVNAENALVYAHKQRSINKSESKKPKSQANMKPLRVRCTSHTYDVYVLISFALCFCFFDFLLTLYRFGRRTQAKFRRLLHLGHPRRIKMKIFSFFFRH